MGYLKVKNWSRKAIHKSELPKHIICDPIKWTIFKRLHYQDRNFLGLIVGDTGIGKSSFAYTLANDLDVTPLGGGQFKRNFVIETLPNGDPAPNCRVIFFVKQFMDLVNQNLPRGSCIVWDEAGVSNDSKEWMTKRNRIVNHILQTFRYKNYAVFFTVPNAESITLDTRRLAHAIFDVNKRDTTKVHVKVQWKWRKRHGDETNVYHPMPAFRDMYGRAFKINDYVVPKPDSDLEASYKLLKDNFNVDLNTKYKQDLKYIEKLDNEMGLESDRIVKQKFDLAPAVEMARANYGALLDSVTKQVDLNKLMYLLSAQRVEANKSQAKMVVEMLGKL